MILELAAGGRILPVRVEREGKKLALYFRKYEPLKEEIKCMKGSKFQDSPPRWLISDCRRNHIQLEIMQGKIPRELVRYKQPLQPFKPRRKNLRPHQLDIASFEWTRRGCVIAAEMGTMKTLPTIENMERAAKELGMDEWWYIGPKNVLTSIKIEFEKWEAKIQPRFITYNSLRKTLEEHRGVAPHGAIYDEASFLKGKGPWYAAAQHLADAIREEHDGFNILLTGTPAPLEATDWHSLVEIARPGLIRESTKKHLERRLAVHEKMDVGTHVFDKVVSWKKDEIEKLGRRIAPAVIVIYAKDVLDLPPLREEIVRLKPSEQMVRAARMVANTAINAAQALNKIRQLSDGFQYQDDDTAERCDTPKDQALFDFLERNRSIGRALVYAPYTESINRCLDLCLRAGWNVLRCDEGKGYRRFDSSGEMPRDDRAEQEWLKNLDRSLDPKTVDNLIFLAHPKSGGYGLNLTAAREGACYSCDFDWGTHAQMLKRAHRNGMDLDHGFTMYYFCHLPTDEYVLTNHKVKEDHQSYALDEIRRLFA